MTIWFWGSMHPIGFAIGRLCWRGLVLALTISMVSLTGACAGTNQRSAALQGASEERVQEETNDVITASSSDKEGASLEALGETHEELLYRGKLSDAVAQIQSAAMAGGPWLWFQAGNMLWTHAPDVALKLHEAALKELPDSHSVQFELALGYTRAARCEEAVRMWERMRSIEPLPKHAGYLAAYCYLDIGNYRDALRVVRESGVREYHVSAEKLSYSVFGGPYPIQLYDAAYRKAEAGDAVALDQLLVLSFYWTRDWWNLGPRAPALKHARALIPTVWPPDSDALRQWNCFWDVLVGSGDIDADALANCGVLVDGQPYPASSALGVILVTRWREHEPADLLFRYGETLWARAASTEGDLSALRILAYLQERAGNREDLARTDDLGWKRYRESRYAVSRLEELNADGPSEDYAQTLEQALADFPNDPRIQFRNIIQRHPVGDVPADKLAALIQAETRSFDLSGHGSRRSSIEVRGLYEYLADVTEGVPLERRASEDR